MTILLYLLGIATAFFGIFYMTKHKKKLSNENLVEFERSIKPKLIKFLFLSFIPILLICAYLISSPEK
ncbi:hypothetical protein [Flavobacterium sp.]|uniref:hypothetical protein n=1 Tax=Flavobacterium sp. TaxID=239 RepID=UPI003D6A04D1